MRRQGSVRCLVVLALVAVGPSGAQSVFIGGRVDLEARAADGLGGGFGRDAGLDLRYHRPEQLEAWADLTLAGGRTRLQELWVRLPQTRKVADVTLGRVLLPVGDPRTNVVDRYAAGGRDGFGLYSGWRHGNVLLDGDLTGAQLGRRCGPVRLTVAGGAVGDTGRGALVGRAVAGSDKLRVGGSYYLGVDGARHPQRLALGHIGVRGGGVEWVANGGWGQGATGQQRVGSWRLGWRPGRSHWDFFAAQTHYDDGQLRAVTSTRLGVRRAFGAFYRGEVRLERHDGVGQHNAVITRFTAVF